MKRIRRTNRFKRLYKERIALDEWLKHDFIESLNAFREDRTWVDDHALEDAMEGQRAFSINDEYQSYLCRKAADEYVFLDVGTHEQVYRRAW